MDVGRLDEGVMMISADLVPEEGGREGELSPSELLLAGCCFFSSLESLLFAMLFSSERD